MNYTITKGYTLSESINIGVNLKDKKVSGALNYKGKQYPLTLNMSDINKGVINISSNDIKNFDIGFCDYSISVSGGMKTNIVGKIYIKQYIVPATTPNITISTTTPDTPKFGDMVVEYE
jgi:hypothetical protein